MKRILSLTLLSLVGCNAFGMGNEPSKKEEPLHNRDTSKEKKVLKNYKLPQDFNNYFKQQIQDLIALKKAPRTEETITKQSKLEEDIKNVLIARSKSRWFYTDDLLPYILTFKKITLPEDKKPTITDSSYGKIIVIPTSVRNTLKNLVVHLLSHNQIDPTCGLSTLANAYALQQQVNQNKKITMLATRTIAESFFTKYQDKLEKGNMLQCAIGEYGVSPQQVVQFGEEIDPKVTIIPMYSPRLGSNQIQQIKQSILTNKITNIMLYKGVGTGHFTLAAIINEGNNKYTIYYLDSNNGVIGSGAQEEGAYLKSLDTLIEQAKKEKPVTTKKEPTAQQKTQYLLEIRKRGLGIAQKYANNVLIENQIQPLQGQIGLLTNVFSENNLNNFISLVKFIPTVAENKLKDPYYKHEVQTGKITQKDVEAIAKDFNEFAQYLENAKKDLYGE